MGVERQDDEDDGPSQYRREKTPNGRRARLSWHSRRPLNRVEKQYRFIDNRGVAVKTVEKETGLLLFWGGFDLPESQLDRENRMGALKAECGGNRSRGEKERQQQNTVSTTGAEGVQGRDEELQEDQQGTRTTKPLTSATFHAGYTSMYGCFSFWRSGIFDPTDGF